MFCFCLEYVQPVSVDNWANKNGTGGDEKPKMEANSDRTVIEQPRFILRIFL